MKQKENKSTLNDIENESEIIKHKIEEIEGKVKKQNQYINLTIE